MFNQYESQKVNCNYLMCGHILILYVFVYFLFFSFLTYIFLKFLVLSKSLLEKKHTFSFGLASLSVAGLHPHKDIKNYV